MTRYLGVALRGHGGGDSLQHGGIGSRVVSRPRPAGIQAPARPGALPAQGMHAHRSGAGFLTKVFMVHLILWALLLLALQPPCHGAAAPQPPQPGQTSVPRVELLGLGVTGWRDLPPRSGLPTNSQLVDWRARGKAVHAAVWSDAGRVGGLLRTQVPLQGRWFNGTGFGIPDYMGDGRYGSGPGSALTPIGSVLSAALLGLPLPNATLLSSLRAYIAVNGVAMDNPPGLAVPKVSTFWYTLVNQAFFAGLTALVPQLDQDVSVQHPAFPRC